MFSILPLVIHDQRRDARAFFCDLLFVSGVALLTRADPVLTTPSESQQRNEEGENNKLEQPASSVGRKAKELLNEMHAASSGKTSSECHRAG
jgi:hypothetical protein